MAFVLGAVWIGWHVEGIMIDNDLLLFFAPPPAEKNSFVKLDHSGILSTEFVSLLEETEFTILIDADPAPKVMWLKDDAALPESYYVHTKTRHLINNK